MKSREQTARARRILIKAPAEKITEIHSLVEECDNLAILRTLDPDLGIMEMIATEGTAEDALSLAAYFERALEAEVLSRGI